PPIPVRDAAGRGVQDRRASPPRGGRGWRRRRIHREICRKSAFYSFNVTHVGTAAPLSKPVSPPPQGSVPSATRSPARPHTLAAIRRRSRKSRPAHPL